MQCALPPRSQIQLAARPIRPILLLYTACGNRCRSIPLWPKYTNTGIHTPCIHLHLLVYLLNKTDNSTYNDRCRVGHGAYASPCMHKHNRYDRSCCLPDLLHTRYRCPRRRSSCTNNNSQWFCWLSRCLAERLMYPHGSPNCSRKRRHIFVHRWLMLLWMGGSLCNARICNRRNSIAVSSHPSRMCHRRTRHIGVWMGLLMGRSLCFLTFPPFFTFFLQYQ